MDSMPVWLRRVGILAGMLAALTAVSVLSPQEISWTARRAGRTMEPPPPKPGDDGKPKPKPKRGESAALSGSTRPAI